MVSIKRLQELLCYEADTGIFTWRVNRRGRFARPGKPAGYQSKYIVIGIDGVLYYAHRLAFLYMTGEMPPEVDHLNGNKHDNRWCNLVASNRLHNNKNQPLFRTNTTGLFGVAWDKSKKRWRARIHADNHDKHLGYFRSLLDACCARKAAEARYGFSPNHGRS